MRTGGVIMVEKPVKLGVLLSGSGSTLQNLLDRIGAGQLDARVEVVVSSRKKAYGIERAKQHGLATAVVARRDFGDEEAFNDALHAELDQYAIDLLVLAGFMSRLRIGEKWRNRVLNVHPALIPAFCGQGYYGHYVHEAVLEYGAKITGATVHFADERYDHGPIILQKAIDVLDTDTPDSLAERVQEVEREIYPEAIQLFAENRLEVRGRRVLVKEKGA